MSISESRKFEDIIVQPWLKRFKVRPIITTKRDDQERQDACESLIKNIKKYRDQGFDVYALSYLLEALIELEVGHKIIRAKAKKDDFYKRYSIATWGKFKAKKGGAHKIRCLIVYFFVRGSKELRDKKKSRLIYNQNRAITETIYLMTLLGLAEEKVSEKNLANMVGAWNKGNHPHKSFSKDFFITPK